MTDDECRRRTSAHIGAAITGLDLNSVTDSVVAQLRQALAGHAVLKFRGQKFVPPDLLKAIRVFGEPVVHPLLRTHPETGDKALYFHILKASHIIGKTPEESRLFLDGLLDSTVRPAFIYRHKWQTGDLVIVDNRSAMHRVHDDYDRSEKSLLHRVILKGDRPF